MRMPKIFKRSRKYPIQKDEYGRSLRKRSFQLFDSGWRPGKVTRELKAKSRTICRYFQDWKLLPQNSESMHRAWRKKLKNDTEFSNKIIKNIAKYFNISEEEVTIRLQQPYGLAQFLKGKWAVRRQKELHSRQEARLQNALALLNMVESCGVSAKWIADEIAKLHHKARQEKGITGFQDH